MATLPKAQDKLNKTVVAYLDGRRLKGYVYDFSAVKDWFRLFPPENPFQSPGAEVAVSELKAVFFVKDFLGNREYRESLPAEPQGHGRKVEVIFSDGEKVVGTTQAYNPQKLGFFLFPADPKSNNIRIFVVNKNVRQIRMI